VTSPWFVLIELAGEHANQIGVLRDLVFAASTEGGEVRAFAPPGRVACLEPGSVSAGLLLMKWRDPTVAMDAVRRTLLPKLARALPSGQQPLVLAVEGLPEQGLPDMLDIPTAASVPAPPSPRGNFLLVIRGTAWDQAKLDKYRDVILPMHKERGGYYEVFAVNPGQVEALSGQWNDKIFAISRWPTRAAAEDFWFSERYQTHAIPIRLGAGRFTVHMLEANGV
jgi:uncharacterized protein (DUF1330 family)